MVAVATVTTSATSVSNVTGVVTMATLINVAIRGQGFNRGQITSVHSGQLLPAVLGVVVVR